MSKVLVFGLGGIGSVYAYILKKAGCHVTVIARSNYRKVKDSGLEFQSVTYGNSVLKPDEIYQSCSEVKSRNDYDFVVCTNKALDPEELPSSIEPVVSSSKKTTIVIIQNGVGAEAPIQKAFPENSIITCVTWVSALQTANGVVQHRNKEFMEIGAYWGANKAQDEQQVAQFADLLTKGGTHFQVCEDMLVKRWEKTVWNAAWNSLTALTQLDTQDLLNSSPIATEVSRRLMDEMISIARAQNIMISESYTDELIKKTHEKGRIISSMQTDVQNNKPVEVEVILGNPMRDSRRLGLATPTVDLAYMLVKAVDWRIRNVASGGKL